MLSFSFFCDRRNQGVFGYDTAIFLIGPRGCGKTTVGHALARARHFQFSDTDHRLQAHEQRTVAEIVQAEGWARFRELETLSLKAVTLPNTVIATGGGIVLAEGKPSVYAGEWRGDLSAGLGVGAD
ncbi:Shikimate kinase III [Klebsiella pneumoniae]|nr:Shikimate kinase III [Klebsiella pneumoniae]